LLPQRAPDLPGYAFAGICIPARQAGGDFYDWQVHRSGVRLALGDVMGKGMPAALLMASVRAALRIAHDVPVAQAVATVNATLAPDLTATDSFITLFYADVEPASGTLTYVDAGHGMAFIHRRDGQVETLRQRAWPLGIAPDAQYHGGSVQLAPDETLVLYSDGLPDGCPDLKLDPEGVAAQLAGVVGVEARLAHLVALATAQGSLVDDLTLVLVQRLSEPDVESPRADA
jgi:sigma-B regulation protein RsbU (phosphoserine phosphatase)